MEKNSIKATCRGPINIALIKYWGKEDEENIIPLNNSISLTLDKSEFFTETCVELYQNNLRTIRLILNGEEQEISKRVMKLIDFFRSKCDDEKFANGELLIKSFNSFPTAAGCASSASSMSCLVKVLSKVFLKDSLSDIELSKLARQGSGSACRSVLGGFVEWYKFNEDYKDSVAVQICNENHWRNLNVLLVIVSDKRKDTSSTDGMRVSKETSELLRCRVENIVPKRLKQMREAIQIKDFDSLCELTIKDSNNFHAVCRDTFPTICYLNDTSNFIIKCVERINNHYGKWICAYTFDAGPNAFLLVENENCEAIVNYLNFIFSEDSDASEKIKNYDSTLVNLLNEMRIYRISIAANIKQIKQFEIGSGVE